MPDKAPKNFFISYTRADRSWAAWIAWHLQEAGYTTVFQDWDFRPGSNFVLDMQSAAADAERTIAVLSPDYLTSPFAQSEWATAFARDPTGAKRLLVPVRVRECDPQGLLPQIVYIDILGLPETAAKEALLAGVVRGRVDPKTKPDFPVTPKARKPRFPGTLPPVWNISFNRNRNFTGRVQLLDGLRAALTSGQPAALTQAIYGMGGVGKTQTAVEYAYRYAAEYEVVWWIRADESTTLSVDYAALASALGLPERDASEPSAIVGAVRRWLGQNGGWLLVFDNAQGLRDVSNYLPQGTTGHVIITSRNPNWRGEVSSLPVELPERKEAVDFLLKRTRSTKATDRRAASKLAKALGDLPLALEQAGAYIEETACSIADYLALFQQHSLELLGRYPRTGNDKETVATTWRVSFEQVKRESPEAQDLLSLCAFLAPDEIPLDDIMSKGIQHLPDSLAEAIKNPIAFREVVASLRRYSLVKVSERRLLSVHRLVQAVGRTRLEPEDMKTWAGIAVTLLSEAFQFDSKLGTWPACSSLLPHALAATEHAKALHVAYEATGRLLTAVGKYSVGRAEFAKVKKALEQALVIDKKFHGANDPTVAEDADNLGFLLKDQGELKGAKEYFEQALDVNLKAYGSSHSKVAVSRNNLGIILKDLGDREGAKKQFERALRINLESYDPEHPEVAVNLNNLGYLLKDKGDIKRAREYFERALKINEIAYGPDHPSVATNLSNLGIIFKDLGDPERAQTYFERALKISEVSYPPNHPEIATNLNNLGYLMKDKGDVDRAREYFERVLGINETVYGIDHPNVASTLSNLGYLCKAGGDLEGARAYFERALAIDRAAYGPNRPEVAMILNQLGSVVQLQGDLKQARALYKRAVTIFSKVLGGDHPYTVEARNNLSA
jgi:tetratricopeptide (TPR) repeat protein